jgi:protein-arginine kinase activator protein McsA
MNEGACRRCGKVGALTKLEVTRSGIHQEWDVCSECLAILLGEGEGEKTESSCSRCGLTLVQLKRTRRLGCPECYSTFATWILNRARFSGWPLSYDFPLPDFLKVPSGGVAKTERLVRLQAELLTAVEGENFERAAEIRDEIRALQEADL